jgi:hypothetical protein
MQEVDRSIRLRRRAGRHIREHVSLCDRLPGATEKIG